VADRQPSEVIPLGLKESSRAGEVLGRAFHDDPLWSALLPDSEVRQTLLARMFTAWIKTLAVAKGVAETTLRLQVVALWLPPGKDIGPWAMARSGFAMPRIVMTMPAQDRKRMMAIDRQFRERRKKLMPDPYWYLMAIGVEPEHQGRGLGSALVRSGMRKADHDRTLIYLETETERNVGYYEHLGFEVIEEIEAIGLGFTVWLMIRSPRGSGSARNRQY